MRHAKQCIAVQQHMCSMQVGEAFKPNCSIRGAQWSGEPLMWKACECLKADERLRIECVWPSESCVAGFEARVVEAA
jgi:hypothetical protein